MAPKNEAYPKSRELADERLRQRRGLRMGIMPTPMTPEQGIAADLIDRLWELDAVRELTLMRLMEDLEPDRLIDPLIRDQAHLCCRAVLNHGGDKAAAVKVMDTLLARAKDANLWPGDDIDDRPDVVSEPLLFGLWLLHRWVSSAGTMSPDLARNMLANALKEVDAESEISEVWDLEYEDFEAAKENAAA